MLSQNKLALFEKKILKTQSCWLWTAVKTPSGYGHFRVENYVAKKYAHRLSYEQYVGPIPPGLCVLHRCDNPSCVNPKHLFVGDYKANNQDKSNKGRHHNQKKTHCPLGHAYDLEKKLKGGRTSRGCSICRNASIRKYMRRIRAEKKIANKNY